MSSTIYINGKFLAQPFTGVQRFALELSRRLVKSGKEIVVLAPPSVQNLSIASEINPVCFGMSNINGWEQFSLPSYLRKLGNPLLLNFGGVGPVGYKNKFLTIHDMSVLKHPEWFSYSYYLYNKILLKKSLENSLRILTVSNFSKNEIAEFFHLPEEQISVINNAVAWNDQSLHNNQTRKNFILTVGSLDPRKNLINSIIAFNSLKIPDLKLVIIGNKQKAHKSQKLSKHLSDNILFRGNLFDEELILYYKTAKLFLFPSLYEGFGIPPLEAQSCDCPVIVSNNSCFHEIFGDSAEFTDPQSVETITNSIRQLLVDENYRSELARRGKQNTLRYSWENSANALLSIISQNTT
ncbi:MAG: glycosyltransferase family 4 protein [Ignavibacteriales bacterium]|nr:glycosyltransferase family 4 protein [Ignavibacteriales bacterium]MCF8316136.1 glycosyltransferase family 4 protein [Ignavibacteriales bacterium]MCF8436638.1 glycosyltransferase family 4 protein [Ignavibacteriales bacterium]